MLKSVLKIIDLLFTTDGANNQFIIHTGKVLANNL